MAELTRDDVQRAARDALNDVKNDIARMRDAVQRIDQRTDDLDRSQDEIRELTRKMDEVHHDADKIDRVMVEIATLKSQLASTNQYLQQVAGYLQAMDQRQRLQGEDEGYRKA